MSPQPKSRFAEVGAWSHRPYPERLERFSVMYAMQHGLPPYATSMSLRQIADEMEALGYGRLSRERVRQLLEAPPQRRRTGGPAELSRAELERRIARWEARATKRAKARADGYREMLERVEGREGV